MDPITIVNLLNTASPGIARLIVMLRKKDGTVGVLQVLDEADQKFAENLKQVTDWLKEHPES